MMGELESDWLRGVGVTVLVTGGGGGDQPSLAVMLATGQFEGWMQLSCELFLTQTTMHSFWCMFWTTVGPGSLQHPSRPGHAGHRLCPGRPAVLHQQHRCV
jgi:hypothetical protein